FFFQAEDGIRDYKVTGVQTCALPIYVEPGHLHRVADLEPVALVRGGDLDLGRVVGPLAVLAERGVLGVEGLDGAREDVGGGVLRSEERRVGKEGGVWVSAEC